MKSGSNDLANRPRRLKEFMGRPHRFGCEPGQARRRSWTKTVVYFKNAFLEENVTEGVLADADYMRNASAALPEGTNHEP